MPRLGFERHVPHDADRMFALVADLESYPRFVPNCTEMVVRRAPGAPENERFAKMTIRFGPITQGYTSRVVADPDARTITAEAVDGPFSHLNSVWRFEPEEGGALVSFDIDFQIANRMLALAAEPAFARKQEEIMEAFVRRADALYGRRAG